MNIKNAAVYFMITCTLSLSIGAAENSPGKNIKILERPFELIGHELWSFGVKLPVKSSHSAPSRVETEELLWALGPENIYRQE